MKKLWLHIEYKLENYQVLTEPLITEYISKFYQNIISKLDSSIDQHILFIFRINLENGSIKTVTKIQKLNLDDVNKDVLIEFIYDKITSVQDSYYSDPIKSIIISYGVRKGKIESSLNLESLNKDIDRSYHIFYNNKLPIALTPSDYGKVVYQIEQKDGKITYLINPKKNVQLLIEQEGNNHFIKYFKNSQLMCEWTDKINLLENSLIREIGKTTIYWKEGEIIWVKVLKTFKIIEKKKISPQLNKNFITMDLETISLNPSNNIEILQLYLLCWYDGVKKQSYLINPLNEEGTKSTIFRVMKDLCRKKYNFHRIYLHNFAKFDAIFLIKYLAEIGTCKPIIHNGKIISFSFSYNKIKLTFRDSYLLLLSSLGKLSKSFKVENPKIIFPIFFNNIDYIGNVPDFKYFSKDVSLEEYNNYKDSFYNKLWSFREEAIKYCLLDCISLYQILTKFNELIHNNFQLNINDYPTLSSLAFGIFRIKYIKDPIVYNISERGITMLSGNVARDIRESYTGGSTDMFIPSNPLGIKIHVYDVNSLYPSVMLNNKYPVGNPTYFEGDLFKYDPELFGFFYCKVTTPNNLNIPILQLHHDTKNGKRTISPLGSFEGWFFSEELKNSLKFGYSFKIIRGYYFKSDYLFKGYVSDLYNLRLNYPKSDPMNYIAKILLNSLYGRFGMRDDFSHSYIYDYSKYKKVERKYSDGKIDLLDTVQLGDKYLVTLKDHKVALKTDLNYSRETHNVNIAIASAVTAYARIHMSQFKDPKFLKDNKLNLYYTDTDSAYFDGPISDSFISSTILGKLKLEGVYDKALFLAPKVYALENKDSKVIKVKGLSNKILDSITISDLEHLLNKDYKLTFEQRKWFRHLDEANIEILNQIYTLKVTDSKRELIYENNQLVGTKPIVINE